jgi:hypothetical protein
MSELAEYATDMERLYLTAIDAANGNIRSAAKALGKSRGTLRSALRRVEAKAARRGHAPAKNLNHPAPEGFLAETSTLLRRNQQTGEDSVVLQWVKNKTDREEFRETMLKAAEAMSSDIPKAKPIKRKTKAVNTDLLNLYVITDYHLGMKADGEETRDANGNWDMAIAEDLLVRWFDEAIIRAPNSGDAVLCQLGDFLHWDGLDAVTPQSGHTLDADDRFDKLVQVAIRVLRRVISILLTKHAQVYVIMAEGNHDLASSVWLRQMFHAMYDNEPRVIVNTSADPYYCHEFGENTLFFHHGHKRKLNQLDHVLVAKFRDAYGRTKHTHAHTGHLHHERVLESNLMTVEQHQTLAAKDAYASRGGWMANRCARVITYHREYGKVEEHSISPEMLKAY